MTSPPPIVEGQTGHREFLRAECGGLLYVESRTSPFPTADNLRTFLTVQRRKETWDEHYALGRVANNLAAALICEGDLEGALEAAREAEGAFIDMLHGGNPHPQTHTFSGLAMVKYNAAVLFLSASSDEIDLGNAEENRLGAFEALIEVGDDADADVEFIRAALLTLPCQM